MPKNSDREMFNALVPKLLDSVSNVHHLKIIYVQIQFCIKLMNNNGSNICCITVLITNN